jgi:hypothetical protein
VLALRPSHARRDHRAGRRGGRGKRRAVAIANFAFNISKGRAVELYNRVESNDPSTSALIAIPLSLSGTEAQGQDIDDMAALEADANFAERTSGSWVRKTWTDTELAAFPSPDDGNNRYDISVPSTTWTTPAAGNNTTGLVIVYDANTGAGTDSNLQLVSHHDFAVTTDGNDVVLNAGVFYRAS